MLAKSEVEESELVAATAVERMRKFRRFMPGGALGLLWLKD